MTSDSVRLVGLRTSEGPLDKVAIRLDGDLTALYGLNGAGKSWVLDSLRFCLTGQRTKSVSRRDSLNTPDRPHVLVAGLGGDMRLDYWMEQEERRAGHRDEGAEVEFDAAGLWRSIELSRLHDRKLGESPLLQPFSASTLQAIGAMDVHALVPGAQSGSWEVWACIDPKQLPENTSLRQQLELFKQLITVATQVLESGHKIDVDPELITEEFIPRLSMYMQLLGEAGLGDRDANEFILNAERDLKNPPEGWGPFELFVDWEYDGLLTEWYESPFAGWIWGKLTSGVFPAIDALTDGNVEILAGMMNDGLPIPMFRLAVVPEALVSIIDMDDVGDVDRLTAQRLMANLEDAPLDLEVQDPSAPEYPYEVIESALASFKLPGWAFQELELLEDRVNSLYQALMSDPPSLKLMIGSPVSWIMGDVLKWYVPDERDRFELRLQDKRGLSTLSAAEQRWARVAIRLALNEPWQASLERRHEDGAPSTQVLGDYGYWFRDPEPPPVASVLLIDEPEAGLHRAAEEHMASGLAQHALRSVQVVVATHSPHLLNRPGVDLVHVHRAGDVSIASALEAADVEGSLGELGLLPSDLIGMYRVFLLVEGEHDEILLREFIGEELDAARVRIIPVRGGSKLPRAMESELLFSMSNAYVAAMLDNVSVQFITETWNVAKKRYETENSDAAIRYLNEAMRTQKGDEYEWLASWLSRAMKKGHNERMVPLGLEAADIIEYLPVGSLVPGCSNKSWEDLRNEHDAALQAANHAKSLRDFKGWLMKTYRGDFSSSALRRAAAETEQVPEEFKRIAWRLREVSSRPIRAS